VACKACLIGVLCAVLLGFVVPLRAAGADEATETFNSLYGADLARVRGTGDTRDDVELAVRLLAAAKRAADQPALVAVLCERACDLALGHPAGYPTALKAMDFLVQTVPERGADCAARTLDIRQRQFDTSGGDARTPAAETLIDALVAAADAKVEAAAPAEAATLLVRARNVARAVSSPRLADLESRAEALTQRMATGHRISDLVALLEKNPQNTGAHEELVRLYLVDLDDPARAAKWLKGVADKTLLKYVPAAAKGVEAPPELACLELGEWYRDLAGKAPAHAKAAMYARARAYLERFLTSHTAKDMNRTRATLALEKVQETVAELTAPSPSQATKPTKVARPTKPAPSAQWVDLLPIVDPAKDVVRGTWHRERGTLAVVNAEANARAAIPVKVQGSYEMQVGFTRTSGDEQVGVILPVGSTGVKLSLGLWKGGQHGLEYIDGKHAGANPTTVKPGKLENGRPYAVGIRVSVSGEQARVVVTLDGKEIINWEGNTSALSVPPGWQLSKPLCPGLCSHKGEVVFDSVRFRMLSGRADPLRRP